MLQEKLEDRTKFWNEEGLSVLRSAIQNGARLDVCQWVYGVYIRGINKKITSKSDSEPVAEQNKSLLKDARMYHWSHLFEWLESLSSSDSSRPSVNNEQSEDSKPWFKSAAVDVIFHVSKDSLWFHQSTVKKAKIDTCATLQDLKQLILTIFVEQSHLEQRQEIYESMVQLRLRHDLWRYELSCDSNEISDMKVYHLLAGNRQRANVEIFVRFGQGLRRFLPSIDVMEKPVAKPSPELSPVSFKDLSAQLLAALVECTPDIVTRPIFPQYSGECLCTNIFMMY